MGKYAKEYELVNQVISAVGNGTNLLEEADFAPDAGNELGVFLYNEYRSAYNNLILKCPWVFASKCCACNYVGAAPDFELDKGETYSVETTYEEGKSYDIAFIYRLNFTKWYWENYRDKAKEKEKTLRIRVQNPKKKTFVTLVNLLEHTPEDKSKIIEAEVVIEPEIKDCPTYFTDCIEAMLKAPLLQKLQGTSDTNEYKLEQARAELALKNAIDANRLLDGRAEIVSATGR